jgi:hypothetical protein
MTDPVFDKEGNLSNLDELTREEVAVAYQEKNRSLFGRITDEETKRKQVEADAAKLKADLEEARKASQSVTPEVTPPAKPELGADELRLIARGLSDEEIAEAKSIAKGKDISLTEALGTDLFRLFQSDLVEKKRKEDAKLGASKGSQDSFIPEGIKEGMTAAEHKAAWKEAQGR